MRLASPLHIGLIPVLADPNHTGTGPSPDTLTAIHCLDHTIHTFHYLWLGHLCMLRWLGFPHWQCHRVYLSNAYGDLVPHISSCPTMPPLHHPTSAHTCAEVGSASLTNKVKCTTTMGMETQGKLSIMQENRTLEVTARLPPVCRMERVANRTRGIWLREKPQCVVGRKFV